MDLGTALLIAASRLDLPGARLLAIATAPGDRPLPDTHLPSLAVADGTTGCHQANLSIMRITSGILARAIAMLA